MCGLLVNVLINLAVSPLAALARIQAIVLERGQVSEEIRQHTSQRVRKQCRDQCAGQKRKPVQIGKRLTLASPRPGPTSAW